MQVRKRDNSLVEFNLNKIKTAISKCFKSVYGDPLDTIKQFEIEEITKEVNEIIFQTLNQVIEIEQIQNIVEERLLQRHLSVYKEYVGYRRHRSEIRKSNENLDEKLLEIISFRKGFQENANKDDKVLNTQRELISCEASKDFALRRMLPKRVSKAHINGDIHVHDLSHAIVGMTNCSLPDIEAMFKHGFHLGSAFIEPPKNFLTACNVLSQVIDVISNGQYGGVSVHEIDKLLEPYAKMSWERELVQSYNDKFDTDYTCMEDFNYSLPNPHDFKNNKPIPQRSRYSYINNAVKRWKKLVFDGLQILEYQLNTYCNSSAQQPFVSISFGLGESVFCKEIQKAILKVRIEGFNKGRVSPVFPKLIYFLKKGLNVDKEDPNYDIKQIALECSSKRIYPDIISYENQLKLYGYAPITPMGCRSFLGKYTHENGSTSPVGRLNMGVCTINLVRCAIESDRNVDKFFKILDNKLEICKEALLYRVNLIKSNVTPRNVPIFYMSRAFSNLNENDKIDEIMDNGKASVSLGYVGIFETTGFLLDNFEWETTEEGKNLALKIMQYLDNKTKQWKEETNYGFSLYGTPAEALSERFHNLDLQKFGEIPFVTGKGHYGNSFHLNVLKQWNCFEKLDFERQFMPYSLGGNFSFVDTPNLQNNLEALEQIWDYAHENCHYVGVNQPSDCCFKCGYKGEMLPYGELGYQCPDCKNEDPTTMSVIRRISGYLSDFGKRMAPKGRITEINNRKKNM